jgi:hypothetical protein
MILYSVTVNIDNNVQEEWLQWMRSVHVPEVLATGLFVENRILRLLNEEDNGGSTYSFQYLLKSMDDYNTYQKEYAPALQASHKMRYADRFVAFRTLLEVVE